MPDNLSKKHVFLENLVFLLVGGLYCWSLSCAVSGFSFNLIRPEYILGVAFAAVLVLIIMLSNRIMLVLGTLGLVAAIIIFFPDLSGAVAQVIAAETLELRQQVELMSAITVIIAIFTCISLKLSINILLLGIMGVVLYCTAFIEGSVNAIAFYCFLLVMAALILVRNYSNKVKNKEIHLGRHMLKALPLAAASMIAAVLVAIPFSSNFSSSSLFPYDSLRDFFQRELLGGFSQKIDFNKEEYMLSGTFDMDSQPLLLVDGESNLNLYGGIADEYTGYSWNKSSTNKSVFEAEYQTVDTATIISLQASDFDTSSITTETLSIEYLLESDILFTPRLTNSFDRLGKRQVYMSNMGEFDASEPISSGGTIEIKYYQESLKDLYGVSNLSSALERHSVSQISVENVFDNQSLSLYPTWNASDQKKYVEEITEQYTELPDSVTSRTSELAESLTKDLDSTSAKADAICSYLVQTYTYSLNPSDSPRDTDFVDYFLFEQKMGYCDSFASAMVVLCRTQGIPARFVYGYHVPVTADEDGNYIVRTRNQHAWAEVYLEGYGWCVFEATPPYAYISATDYKPNINIDPDGGEDMANHLADLGLLMNQEEYSEEIQMEEQSDIQQQGQSEEVQPDSNEEEVIPTSTRNSYRTAIYIAIGFLSLLMLIFLTRYRMRVAKQSRAVKGTTEQLTEYSFHCILKLAKFAGCEFDSSLTPIELMGQLSKYYPMLKDQLNAAGEIYSCLTYSKNQINTEQSNQVFQTYLAFDRYIKEEFNNLRYLMVKYFLHRI